LNLAVEIAPGFGKTVSPHTSASAKAAYSLAVTQSAGVPVMRMNVTATPAGAGWKLRNGYTTLAEE
jgi:hypothetical protein